MWGLWLVIEPKNRQILAQSISQERNMFVAEYFLSNIVRDYGKYPFPQMKRLVLTTTSL